MWDAVRWHAVDYLPRLHCWSSKGEIALLHVIFYCLLQNNVLAYISFYSPSRFLPFFFFGCVQALEIYIFFLLLRTVENCLYEMGKDRDMLNLAFYLLNLLREKILMQAGMRSGKDHRLKSWLTLASPFPSFLVTVCWNLLCWGEVVICF